MADIDLTPFCDPDSPRYDLSTPFVIDGFMYATDATILVRVPSEGPKTTRKVPDVKAIFAAADFGSEMKVPEWELTSEVYRSGVYSYCDDCRGHLRLCVKCKGAKGAVCSSCGHFEKCEECSGRGWRGSRCVECREAARQVGVDIGGEWWSLSLKNIGRMGALPGLHIGKPDLKVAGSGYIPFVFDGGSGVVMPLIIDQPAYAEACEASA